jgi:hypothetical protein
MRNFRTRHVGSVLAKGLRILARVCRVILAGSLWPTAESAWDAPWKA